MAVPGNKETANGICSVCGKEHCRGSHRGYNGDAKKASEVTTANYNILINQKSVTYGENHKPSFNEFLTLIQQDPTHEHCVSLTHIKDMVSDVYYLDDMKTGSENRVISSISQYTIADIHTHPESGLPTPSPIDLVNTASLAKYENLENRYILAANGDIYALYIEDHQKASAFAEAYSKQLDYTKNEFPIRSEINKNWKKAQKLYFYLKGYKQLEYTIAYILHYFDSGIKILKKEQTDTIFRTLYIEKRNGYYTPYEYR